MPFRSGNTYGVPGKGSYTNRNGKVTFTGKGPAPSGAKKAPEKSYAQVPVTTTSPTGQVTTSGFNSQSAARQAQRSAQAARQRVQRIIQQTTPKPQKLSQPPPIPAAYRPQVAPKPPSFKPVKFQGQPTAGTPTLKALQVASKSGGLKVNRRGFLTTPKVRQVSQKLKQAKKAVSKTGVQGPLVPQQKRFVKGVAKHTKLSPRAVGAQALAEESGQAAKEREATGEHNYLNIGPGQHFGSNRQAVKATSKLLDTSPNYAGIRATRGKGAAAQVQAIGASSWGTNEATMAGTLALVHAKSDPAAARRLKEAKAQAAKIGLKGAKKHFRYANPLPGWTPGRTDQGFDASAPPGTPVLAVSKGKVIATGAPGWPGGGGVTYKILQGPQKGKEIYAFEDLSATVKPGQIVKRGQVVAKAGAGSIETGYYSGNQTTAGHPLNNQVVGTGQTYSVASTDGSPTVGALQFEKQILKKAVSVPASGGSAGYFVTGPTVSAYATATGATTQAVTKEIKSRRLTPMQIFHKLKALGVSVTPAGVGVGSPTKTATATRGQTAPTSELARLEKKYGVT